MSTSHSSISQNNHTPSITKEQFSKLKSYLLKNNNIIYNQEALTIWLLYNSEAFQQRRLQIVYILNILKL